jgi:hypothetical protein
MISRRNLLFSAAAAATGREALVSISIDLEMARNYPTWDQTHWDYEKGNLNDAAKQYALGAARRVKDRGGLIHFFAVGRVFEQESVAWLEEIVRLGHPIGNHTYDHVNIRATQLESVQPRFRRAPWLMAGKTALEAISDNIRLTTIAMKARLGIEPAGFRSPGGFPEGIADLPAVQKALLDQGFWWVSTKYPNHPTGVAGYDPNWRGGTLPEPVPAVYAGILKAQAAAQPFVYLSGLVEVPMCPISDLIAFRTGHWKLEYFLKSLRQILEQTIEQRSVFVFLGHPSCLSVVDPEFRTMDLFTEIVNKAGARARLTDLGAIARTLKKS